MITPFLNKNSITRVSMIKEKDAWQMGTPTPPNTSFEKKL